MAETKIVKTLRFPNDQNDYNINAVKLNGEDKSSILENSALTGTPTAPTASAGTNTTQVATTAFVNTEINNKLAANDAMIFKGTIGTGGTVEALPASHNAGWTYKVIEAGTYANFKCEIGDMIICTVDGTSANNSHWTVVQTNVDGAVTGPSSATNNNFVAFDGNTGRIIKDSTYNANSFASKEHTHNYAESSTPGGAATSAQKLTVNGGDQNTPVYFSNGVPVPCTNIDEGNIVWSSKSRAGSITPLDIAMSSLHNPNRLAFANPDGIKIEYSTNGTTFTDYPNVTDNQKIGLVTGLTASFTIGAKNNNITVTDKLRVTLNATNMGVYTLARKLLLNISTSGASGSHVIVEVSNKGSEATFRQVGDYPLSGWSGWNSIPLNGMSFGGDDNQTSNIAVIRLTFGITGLSSSSSSALKLSDISLHGETAWRTPSTLARTGQVYSYDSEQNVSFPASVTASAFNGYLVGNISGNARTADKATYDTNGNQIDIIYATKAEENNRYTHSQGSMSNKDLNTIKTAGWYYGYTGMTNAPAQYISVMEVIVYSPDWVVQRFTVIDGKEYTRHWYSATTWTEWKEYIRSDSTTDDIQGGSVTWHFNCGTSTTVLD